jgi:transposase-like protein
MRTVTCAKSGCRPTERRRTSPSPHSLKKYAPKYDKAVECLLKDREALLTFFDFPAEHWVHPRTSNPIESVFATVRHRTVRMKGALSRDTARVMVFKLVMAAAKSWRRLQGQNQS